MSTAVDPRAWIDEAAAVEDDDLTDETESLTEHPEDAGGGEASDPENDAEDNGQDETQDDDAAPETGATADEATNATREAATPAAPADAPSVPPDEPSPPREPLVITASRKQHPIPGVHRVRTADGERLEVEPAALTRVTTLLRQGLDAEQVLVPETIALRKKVVELEKQAGEMRTAREAQADAMVQELEKILDGGPESVLAFLEDYARQRPILEAKGIEARAKFREEQARRMTEPAQEDYLAAVEHEARTELSGMVETYLTQQGVAPEDIKAVDTRLQQRLGAFVVQVPHDMPEMGLRAGQYALNAQLLEQELAYEATLRKEAATAKAEAARFKQEAEAKVAAAKARGAAERNAAALKAAQASRPTPNPKRETPAKPVNARDRRSQWLTEMLADDDE